jgi:hypothetical protein
MYIQNIDKINESNTFECDWNLGKYIEKRLSISPLNKDKKNKKYIFAKTNELEIGLQTILEEYRNRW